MIFDSDWKETMDSIIELDEDVVVIIGTSDIVEWKINTGVSPKMFKDLTDKSFYRIIGRGPDELILNAFIDYECDVDVEGEYQFKAILGWVNDDYSNYLDIRHIEFYLIQTFTEREREQKINELLDIDDDFDWF